MSYCSVCGIHCQPNDSTCSECGNELIKEIAKEHITEPVAGDIAGIKKCEADCLGNQEMGSDHNKESQLGKGLIKPHSIELEIDGFHFKYDKPSRNFGKVENFKDKVVEFRVTCPDPEVEPFLETDEKESSWEGIPQEEISPEAADQRGESVEIESSGVAEAMQAEEPETIEAINSIPESADQPLEKEIWMAGEILPEVTPDSQLDVETTVPPELPEMETTTDTEILWEDSQRWLGWLGIPLSNQYRISTRSLQIMERLARKFSEIDLVLISEVKLKQTWLNKLFGTGDLLISVKHLPETGLVLKGVRHPESVRQLLKDLINCAE